MLRTARCVLSFFVTSQHSRSTNFIVIPIETSDRKFNVGCALAAATGGDNIVGLQNIRESQVSNVELFTHETDVSSNVL